MIELRDYQSAAVDATFDALSELQSTLIAAAVGAGKTLIQATLFQRTMQLNPAARCLSLAHTQELIKQNFGAMLKVWPGAPAGVNSAALGRRDTRHPIIFASIQSVAKHARKIGWIDLVSIDEAHLIPTASTSLYQSFLAELREINPDVKFVGLSGTPFRLTTGYLHKGASAMFDSMCYEITIPELISRGFLVPPISLNMTTQFDVTGVKMSGGDYVASALQDRVDDDDTTRAAVAEMVEIGRMQERRAWMAFCAGIKHSESVRDEIRRHGIVCEAIDGAMGNAERGAMIEAFKAGRIQCLTNVNVLSIGFDYPGVDMLALMRPTKSVGLYIQQVGRGLRCLGVDYEASVKAGKANCIVLDYCNLVQNLGPIDQPIVKDEKKSQKRDEAMPPPQKVCLSCRSYNAPAARFCSTCDEPFQIEPSSAKIERTASALPILSGSAPASSADKPRGIHDWIGVDYACLRLHRKFGEPKATPTMKVSYYNGKTSCTEWVCLFHPEGTTPHRKALDWWRDRKMIGAPPTIADLEGTEIDVTSHFEAVKNKKEGTLDRIFAWRVRKPEDEEAFLAGYGKSEKTAHERMLDEIADDIPF